MSSRITRRAPGTPPNLLVLLLLLARCRRAVAPACLPIAPACQVADGEDVGQLEDGVPVHFYPEGEAAVAASSQQPLDASNKGFQLLQRLGWKGAGLGKHENGVRTCCCRFAACAALCGGTRPASADVIAHAARRAPAAARHG